MKSPWEMVRGQAIAPIPPAQRSAARRWAASCAARLPEPEQIPALAAVLDALGLNRDDKEETQ